MILLSSLMLAVALPAAASLLEGEEGGLDPMSLAGPVAARRLDPPVDFAQMTIEQRVIIRVPMMRPGMPPPPPDMRGRSQADAPPPPPPPMKWIERKGPRCVQLMQLRAASITSSQGVDLMMRDATRLRARLGRECRPEDLYSGFYIQPHSDGTLCAGRDRLLARSGASCPISDFRRLVPDK